MIRGKYLWLLAVMLPIAVQAETRWLRLSTDHFEMYSSAGEGSSRETLRSFEQVRTFFQAAALHASSAQGRVFIIGFNSEKEYAPYRFNEFASAYYHPGADRDYIVMGKVGPDTFPVAVHEYVHLVVRHAGLNFAPWLNEGIAELYSTLRPQGGKLLVGAPIVNRLQAMLQDKWVPLPAIVGASHDSPYYNEKNRAGYLYNEGWALVQMLALGDGYREKFNDLLVALGDGSNSQPALERIYGKTLAQIDKELQSYIRSSAFNAAVLNTKLDKSKEEIPAAPASDFDVNLALADLSNRPGKEGSQERLEKLARENPDRPEPWAGLAYIAWRQGHLEETEQNFEKAYKLGARSPRLLWDYGRLAERRNPQIALAAFRALAEQEPNRVDVRLEIAALHLSGGSAGEGYQTLVGLKHISPADAPRFYTLTAYAQLQLGSREAAATSVEKLAKYAKTDTELAELARLQSYVATPATTTTVAAGPVASSTPLRPSEEPSEVGPETQAPTLQRSAQLKDRSTVTEYAQTPSVSGTFAALVCAGDQARIVLDTGSGKKTFLITDPNRITVVGIEGGKLDLQCGAQSPKPIRIEYTLPTAAGVDGDVRVLYFEK